MEFVALDVETANANMASICQIGIAHFTNGQLTNEWKTYVDPQDHFDGMNVSIHGIDESVVEGAPTFQMLTKTIESVLNGRIVVTHTAFDKVAIYQAGTKCRATPPSCTWLDSACVVRRTWKEFSKSGYGLLNVCDSIGYKFQAHDALEDAKAAGNILLAAMAHTGLDLNAWVARVRHSPLGARGHAGSAWRTASVRRCVDAATQDPSNRRIKQLEVFFGAWRLKMVVE